jgi:hypothetical protein
MGPLTPADLATVRAFEQSLRDAYQAAAQAMTSMSGAAEPMRRAAAQVARAQTLIASFDAAPRHRRLPTRATVIGWLDRHLPPAAVRIIDDPYGRLPLDLGAQQSAVQWYVEQRLLAEQAAEQLPTDGPPVDVERDQAGEYRSMWPGGIGA